MEGKQPAEVSKETKDPNVSKEGGEEGEEPQEPQIQFEEGEDVEGVEEEEEEEEEEEQREKKEGDDEEDVPIKPFGHKAYKDTIQVNRGGKQRKPIDDGAAPGPHKVQFS